MADRFERLKIRLEEQLKIYKDSPNVQVTYVDLARLIENLLDILEYRKINGFKE